MYSKGGLAVFGNSPFENKPQVNIPDNCDVVFVSDLFTSDHAGGAEMTTDALIDSSPYKVFRLHSRDVNDETLEQGLNKFWVFGNFFGMDMRLLPTIISNISYSILEYDYKYCKYRSPEKHQAAENKSCDCHDQMHGKMISAFLYGAQSLWWMSQSQMKVYHSKFPFLGNVRNEVLSSVFNEDFFKTVTNLVKDNSHERSGWVVVGSNSWIKGVNESETYCKEKGLDYEVIWNVPYYDLLERLSRSEGLVFLPNGNDTCPRLVIEAKLLGCDLTINDHVQHAKEEWFITDDFTKTLKHLYFARSRFWNQIKKQIDHKPTISGYTTTLNCIRQRYPFEESIASMLGFCDQVVVVDGGSDDGTWETLESIASKDERVIIHKQDRDMSDSRFAVFDGLQKALARALCGGEFCWQQDSDEIVHENDYEKVRNLVGQISKNMDLIALPVTEFWGSKDKIRIDVNPWKWRLSRNRPHITHGIPANLRKFDSDGKLYSLPGTDGCDYIRSDSFEQIPFANFYTEEAHSARVSALEGDEDALKQYSSWISQVRESLPCVYHYSWFDLKRKIRTYRDYWSKHWQSLYDIKQDDTPENNMFFDKSWSDVSEEEIDKLSVKLSEEMGGWIFHSKVDFSKPTPSLALDGEHPEIIKKWINK
jgi:glycosyltransferase involved in cell wall biosynthesis